MGYSERVVQQKKGPLSEGPVRIEIMPQSRWLLHPIVIFVGSIAALVTSLFLYIYWYIEISSGLTSLMRKFDLDREQVLASETWLVIMVLSILVGFILLGIFLIFLYNQKTLRLYRLQNSFINNFTHELKTPVTSLRLYLETFRKHDLPRDNQMKYIDYMIHDTLRLNDTINSILDLARIESKSFTGNFARKDLREVVEGFFEGNAHVLGECRVTTRFPEDRTLLYPIDPVLFDMLLMNLVTNAVKYNTSKRPTLTVTLGVRRRRILLSFEDNGIGIDKTELKKIFRKFYQAGGGKNRVARGSGLGLFMAQSIAKLHGARLKAKSEGLGRGSLFTLCLPDRYATPFWNRGEG